MRKRYPSDLTDEQWAVLEPLIPAARPGGRPRTIDLREVVNALFYQAKTGCPWDYLPHDLPPKSTAWDYFARWQNDGTWLELVDALRVQDGYSWLLRSGALPGIVCRAGSAPALLVLRVRAASPRQESGRPARRFHGPTSAFCRESVIFACQAESGAPGPFRRVSEVFGE